MRQRLSITVGSILLGWAALFAITYFIVRPLLHWSAPWLGASWLPTVELTLECVALAGAGWIIGRLNPSGRVPVILVFAVMLALWNFGLVPAINIAWLFRLMIDALGSSRYLESLITAAATQALLFGSLFTGARLSHRARNTPMSLMSGDLR
jgi:hypothetical protein